MTRPLVRFLIGGAQKAGTSALARYLGGHAQVRLPVHKEAHVFDAPDFDQAWPVETVNDRYRRHFAGDLEGRLVGDATPIYVFLPQVVQRIAHYNPTMRWILLLREPADRAISQYHMESARGLESWPLWAAILFERWRLRGHWQDLSADSPLRTHSYCARGDYARQLDVLFEYFPRNQVLLLKNTELRDDPLKSMASVYRFLELPCPDRSPSFESVFEGRYISTPGHRAIRSLLRALMHRQRAELRIRYGVDFD